MPAVLGLKSLTNMRALLDVANGRLYRVGPGGYELKLSPGSHVHRLERANAGHLMLPCSEFAEQPSRTNLALHTRKADENKSS